MTDTTDPRDRTKAILVLIATIATIIFNGLAAAGLVNGVTPASILAKYPTLLTPAAYAFSIWWLIYVGLLAFSVFQLLPINFGRFRPVRTLYIISCLLNCLWIYFWHREQIGLCFAVVVVLLATLVLIQIKLRCSSFAETWLQQAPFGLYFGWVTAAAIVNLAVLLKYLGSGAAASSALAAGLMLIAAASAVAVRIKFRNFFYPLAIGWALTAIAIKQSGNTTIVVAAAGGVVVCLVTTGSFVVHLKGTQISE